MVEFYEMPEELKINTREELDALLGRLSVGGAKVVAGCRLGS